MHIIFILSIAISLSMDAFSLATIYGTLPMNKKDKFLLSLIVGIYHFIMPLLGFSIGTFLIYTLHIKPNLIVFLVFTFIGIQMILESLKKEETIQNLNLMDMILFGLAVSIDSFSVGLGLGAITNKIFIVPFIFSITSFVFTYLGLLLGGKIKETFGKITTCIGGIFLIAIGIFYIFK